MYFVFEINFKNTCIFYLEFKFEKYFIFWFLKLMHFVFCIENDFLMYFAELWYYLTTQVNRSRVQDFTSSKYRAAALSDFISRLKITKLKGKQSEFIHHLGECEKLRKGGEEFDCKISWDFQGKAQISSKPGKIINYSGKFK